MHRTLLVILFVGFVLLDTGTVKADNCTNVANEPGDLSNQVDSDRDGYGNACDADFNNDIATNASDMAEMIGVMGCGIPGNACSTFSCEYDLDGDSTVTGNPGNDFPTFTLNGEPSIGDWAILLTKFFAPVGSPLNEPGPSSLACAGTTPCGAGVANHSTPAKDVNNPADWTGLGSVPTGFGISPFEVTNSDYAVFLNAMAVDDPYGLYNTAMGTAPGGIVRTGGPGSFAYSAIPGRERKPVNFVSFLDAIRFANWLHNDQPSSLGNPTTEDGAYTITPQGIADNSITRNIGARAFLPTEDEWYKTAYYDPSTSTYFTFPMKSNLVPTCGAPANLPNTANCAGAAGNDLTDIASYPQARSPYGTFDQGGNVREWNETIVGSTDRGLRGGSFAIGVNELDSAFGGSTDHTTEQMDIGFRVASFNSVCSQ